MTDPIATSPQRGIFFRTHVRFIGSLDALATAIMASTGIDLNQTDERGLHGDYLGNLLGMELHLHVSYREKFEDTPVPPSGTTFVFEGNALVDEGREVEWTDLSFYVTEWIGRLSGLAWSASHPEP